MSLGFNQQSVNSGLARLVEHFCKQHALQVPMECFQYQNAQRIPFSVWQQILQQVDQQYRQPALGLHIAQMIEPSHTGIIGYLCLACQNLGEALLRFEHYHRLAYDCNDLQISIGSQTVEISWGIGAGKPGQLVDETALALFKNIASQLIYPVPLELTRVDFVNIKPEKSQVYQQYFGCPVIFNAARTRINFPVQLLNIAVSRADQTLQQLLENQASALLSELPEHDQFDQQLQLYMSQAVHHGSICINNIAQQMGLSTRALQRQLVKRGYSFQQRLAQVRETLAKHYLSDAKLSLIDIALLLAYSEQSAFQRAFKQWTSQTPHQWRICQSLKQKEQT